MDPAGPFYNTTATKDKLAKGDAQFVQVIHSCAGGLGYNGVLGDADYWPNGGTRPQPGCEELVELDLLGNVSDLQNICLLIHTTRLKNGIH